MTVATTYLWVSNGGRVVCEEHGGMYLQAAVGLRPKARTHTTPLDRWERVVDGSVDDGWTWRCEECSR